MKKLLTLLMVVLMALSLVACGGKTISEETNDSSNEPQTIDERISNAVKIDIDSFLKECSSNIAKASVDYEGKDCVIEGYVSEIQKDHIVLQYNYLYADVYLPTEQIIEVQTQQYIEVIGLLENLEYDAYSGAFADLNSAIVSKDTFSKTGEYNAYHTTDGTHPQDVCLKCIDDSGIYYIELELTPEQASTLESGTEITIEGKLFSNYWDIMPNSAEYKMIDIEIK